MRHPYRNLSIQNQLFLAFALTVLVAALNVAVSLGVLLHVQSLSMDVVRNYQTAQQVYQVQNYLQEMDGIRRSYILSANINDVDPFLVYTALFSDYLRQASLESAQPETANALYEIERARDAYLTAFREITKPQNQRGNNSQQVSSWIGQGDQAMATMRAQLSIIAQQALKAFNQAQASQQVFLSFAAGLGVFSLVLSLIMATMAYRVIRRRIFAPAARLSQVAQALAAGGFSPEMLAALEGEAGEILQLTRSFSQLAAAVEADESQLLAQIAEVRSRLGDGE